MMSFPLFEITILAMIMVSEASTVDLLSNFDDLHETKNSKNKNMENNKKVNHFLYKNHFLR